MAALKWLGVEKNPELAISYFRKAAKQKNPQSMRHLGFCFQREMGVTKDATMAVEWFKRAALLGDRIALFNLGYLCQMGEGMQHDAKLAAELLLAAAELGHEPAESYLLELSNNLDNPFAAEKLVELERKRNQTK
jgi:TPR repeat protein